MVPRNIKYFEVGILTTQPRRLTSWRGDNGTRGIGVKLGDELGRGRRRSCRIGVGAYATEPTTKEGTEESYFEVRLRKQDQVPGISYRTKFEPRFRTKKQVWFVYKNVCTVPHLGRTDLVQIICRSFPLLTI